ncbi:hypothetical protein B0H17DRAFT_1144712 [Mycena rosella]|uniref:Uncharacterized protein n=1 Tax=Mycena rosella TaxID=1033263 RepID=A0AAD7G6E1_MYCRO|nr:hypothetical protein B0H17DRAFT_1144712 [Mycena rosella]
MVREEKKAHKCEFAGPGTPKFASDHAVQQDQDSWGEGTGGSISKPTNVVALGGVACQAATHQCQGVWICDQFNHSLSEGHERYEPDDDAMRELWAADQAVNVRDTSSMYTRVAAYYTEVHRKKCKFVGSDGAQFTGAPVYRKLKRMNLDSKYGFIGCENYAPGESHRFITINRDVDEEPLLEVFQNNYRFASFVNVITANCARVLPLRQGGKGECVCPYPHIDSNGIVVKGRLIRRKCKTTIKIFAPIDRDDRRVIVYLSGAHNHPRPPSTKLTRTRKDVRKEAIVTAGTTGLTVLKCDNGSKFTSMAKVVPDEEMGRIRRCLYLKTPHELDEFIDWCKKSEHKVVRDWMKDKESIKAGFWPSINEFLSDISKEDWYLTPGDTNLNENLEVEAKIKHMEQSCVLVNHQNSKALRDRHIVSRRASHHQQALNRTEARKELEEIDEAMKALEEKKKAIQETTGVKKMKKKGEKVKVKAADKGELAETIDDAASDVPEPTDLAGTGLEPVPASYAEQTALLSAPLGSNVGIQLEPELEPIFLPAGGAGYNFHLEGDLEDYIYLF